MYRGREGQQGVAAGQNEAIEDVQLGPLLGQGGFGKVYRGLWNGAAVAVKVSYPKPRCKHFVCHSISRQCCRFGSIAAPACTYSMIVCQGVLGRQS